MRRSSFTRFAILAGASAVAIGLAQAAVADVYRWTQPDGVTAYGAKPPADAQRVTRIEDTRGNVSVVPMPERIRDAAARPAGEATGATERAPVTLASGEPPEGAALYTSRRERCFAERRVDCADPTPSTFDAIRSYTPRP